MTVWHSGGGKGMATLAQGAALLFAVNSNQGSINSLKQDFANVCTN